MIFHTPDNMFNNAIHSRFSDIIKLQDKIIHYIKTDGNQVFQELSSGGLYEGAYKNKLIMVNDRAGQPLVTITKDGIINRLKPFSPLNPEHLNDDMDIVHQVEIDDTETIQFSPVSEHLDIPIINADDKIRLDEGYIKQAEQVYEESVNILLNKAQTKVAMELPATQKKLYGLMKELTGVNNGEPDTIKPPEVLTAGKIFTMTALPRAFSEAIQTYFEEPEMGNDIRNFSFQQIINHHVQEFFNKQNDILAVYNKENIPLPPDDSELDYGSPPYLLADKDILMPYFLVKESGKLVKLLPFLDIEEHLNDEYEAIYTTMLGASGNLIRFIPIFDTFEAPEFDNNYQFKLEDSVVDTANNVYTMFFSSFESILRANASGNIVGLFSALKTYMSENNLSMDDLISNGMVYNELRSQIANAMQFAIQRTEVIMHHLIEDIMQQM